MVIVAIVIFVIYFNILLHLAILLAMLFEFLFLRVIDGVKVVTDFCFYLADKTLGI